MIDFQEKTDNMRISDQKTLVPAGVIHEDQPITRSAASTVITARKAIERSLHGQDDRLVVVVGPCSVHDVKAAKEYAELLYQAAKQYSDQLIIVMRVYFEKPRTTVGWKGLINDPDLDNSFKINKGLRMARQLLLDISDMGLPCATEFLDVVSPQYISDLISWGAIGARTTESQVHRELASGLSCPIGFKNGTKGSLDIAVDAVKAAKSKHHFLGVTKQGTTAIFETKGNADSHVILRGGKTGPNYSKECVDKVALMLEEAKLPHKVMVDCSHGNSNKDYKKQIVVVDEVCQQIKQGSKNILGVMIESNLKAGNQSIFVTPLEYGKSITDACVDWQETTQMLANLAKAVQEVRGH
ncbi:3-deoxy-7-phosphoheptulonate synthase [Facilibium subflavum]|uniref:3-deoxy-7-phosphoheptulonate synthase n=1 Tax=Facilibium subflavum TaxID=2219058 RepID=UPI002E26EE05